MAIKFEQLPSALRFGAFYTEDIGNKNASSVEQQSALLIGQKLATGSGSGIMQITSGKQALELFGDGSMLQSMYTGFVDNNPFIPVYAYIASDPSSGIQATATITITGSITTAGQDAFYICGKVISVIFATGDTPSQAAVKIKNAINAVTGLAVVATSSAGVVTLTARHTGVVGNQLQLGVNLVTSGDTSTTTHSYAIVKFKRGAGEIDYNAVVAAMGETLYKYIVYPYPNRAIIETEMQSRYAPVRWLHGHLFTAKHGTLAEVKTFGKEGNAFVTTCFDAADSNTPTYEVAARGAGATSKKLSANYLSGMIGINVRGMMAITDRGIVQNNDMLFSGITPLQVVRGLVKLNRVITMYQLDSSGSPISEKLDIHVPFVIAEINRVRRVEGFNKFKNATVAKTSEGFPAGTTVVTPAIFKQFLYKSYQKFINKGWTQDLDGYKDTVVVEINAADKSRIDYTDTLQITSVLSVIAGSTQHF